MLRITIRNLLSLLLLLHLQMIVTAVVVKMMMAVWIHYEMKKRFLPKIVMVGYSLFEHHELKWKLSRPLI